MKVLVCTVFFTFVMTASIFSKDKAGALPKIAISEDGIVLNEQNLKADQNVEYYQAILGDFNVKENREDGLYYTWDKLGLKLREDAKTKNINQISLFLTIVGTSTTKSPYKGKLTIMGKDINFSTNPSKLKNELECEQIFCAFKLDTKTVYTNLTLDKKKFQHIQIELP